MSTKTFLLALLALVVFTAPSLAAFDAPLPHIGHKPHHGGRHVMPPGSSPMPHEHHAMPPHFEHHHPGHEHFAHPPFHAGALSPHGPHHHGHGYGHGHGHGHGHGPAQPPMEQGGFPHKYPRKMRPAHAPAPHTAY